MNDILNFISQTDLSTLDIIGAVLGVIYIIFEYRASIWLWFFSIIMPLVDMFLYLKAGLYADFGMAIYYALAAIYGYLVWKFGKKKNQKQGEELPITHFRKDKILPTIASGIGIWGLFYIILSQFTDSTVPFTDSFVNALSVIALWALARKYVEQWLIWIVVDAICCGLYAHKGIPFKASLYGFYVIFAVFGYIRWKKRIHNETIS